MKNLIEIKVDCKGSSVGTLGWLNSILEGSEFVIKNNKNGTPGMFLKTKNKKSSDGFDYNFICKKINLDTDSSCMYYRHDDFGFVWVYPETPNDEKCGFSDYPLTPAATEKLEELIDKAVHSFIEWWETN